MASLRISRQLSSFYTSPHAQHQYNRYSKHLSWPPSNVPFDICEPRKSEGPNVHITDSDTHDDTRRCSQILQTGMVLLRNFIDKNDQVKIVKLCRDFGIGPGGFYQPMFKSGGKMNLQMMCLGHHWEPTTNKYIHRLLIDSIEPPDIPVEFKRLIKKAIKDSHDLIKEELDVSNVHKILPLMDPDICVINFYTESGSLGLHQDKSESWDSVKKGLPVVSVSIGDSAEFLYGDTRDISGLKKIILESGDVVIFGGESRNVFHGVPSIFPNSAPRFLAYEANLCPGRLNLTFREY